MTLALLAAWTIRSSLVLLAALGLSKMLARGSAAQRHWVLAVGTVGALVMPLAATVAPHWSIAPPAAAQRSAPSTTGGQVTVTTIAVSRDVAPRPAVPAAALVTGRRLLEPSLLVVWGCGVCIFALALGVGLLRVGAVARRSRPMRDERWSAAAAALGRERPSLRRLTLLESPNDALLVTWGVRPRVLLPRGARGWSDERIAVVLAHETAHIERRDWLIQIVGELLRTMFWFNPLAWSTAARLRLESERACDDRVLACGVAPSTYAHHLVDVARLLSPSHAGAPLPAMARASSLERRISAMLDHHVNRSPLTRTARYAAGGVLVAMTLSIASYAAQSPFATVSGVVRDQMGGTIPSVTLTLTSARDGAKHEIKSDSSGAFEFVGVPAGNYTLSTHAPGFKQADAAMQVAAGQALRRDLRLDVGLLQETITVAEAATGGAPSRNGTRRPMNLSSDPSACTALPNSGGIKPPTKIVDVKPKYPGSMLGTGIEGRVSLKATIGIDGAIKTLETVEATNSDFDLSGQEAVRQWRFTPTLLNCVPVDVDMNVAISFRPDGGNSVDVTRGASPAPPTPTPPTPPTPPQR